MDIRIIKIQSDIIKKMHAKNGVTVHFESYSEPVKTNNIIKDAGDLSHLLGHGVLTYKLNLVTYNPIHQQIFLAHNSEGKTELECYENMLEYIVTHEELGDRTWTVKWRKKGSLEEDTISYFSGKDVISALEKFYYGKDEDTLIISSVTLNSMA